jgi:hypothetical protein
LGSGAKTIELQDWSAIYESYLLLEAGEVKVALQKFIGAELRVKVQFDTYPNLVVRNALAAWRSGHRIGLQDSRPGFESRQGIRFLGKT